MTVGNADTRFEARRGAVSPTVTRYYTEIPHEPAYVRPSDWLTLPTLSDGDQKFVGLMAVLNEDQNLALLATTSTGTFTVDWGDNTTPTTHTSNTKAEHQYDYSSLAGSPSTECSRGYRQVIVTVTATTGNLTGINLIQAHTLQRTTSPNVIPWLDIAVNSPNLTTLVLASGTPCRLDWCERIWIGQHNMTSWASLIKDNHGVREVVANGAGITSMQQMFDGCFSLQRAEITNASSVTNLSYMFRYCYAMEEASVVGTTAATTFLSMFYQCHGLRQCYVPNTSTVTTTTDMFYQCWALKRAPGMHLVEVAEAIRMFYQCYALVEVPTYSLNKCTQAGSMFYQCYALEAVAIYDFGKDVTGVQCSQMFYGCSALRFPLFLGTPKIKNMQQFFYGCRSLRRVQAFDTQYCTNFTSMFDFCSALLEAPALDFTSHTATYLAGLFSNCYALRTVPAYDMQAVNAWTTVFNNCYTLQEIPTITFDTGLSYIQYNGNNYSLMKIGALDLSNCTNSANMVQGFSGAYSMRVVDFFGIRCNFDSMRYKPLCKDELEKIMDNLGKVSGTQDWVVSNSDGAPVPVSKTSCGTTSGSTTVTQSNTSSLETGMEVSGTGVTDVRAVTFTDAGDLVNRTAHGIPDGQKVSFSSITSTTGIVIDTIYYVINATADSFQVTDTPGSPSTALPLTTDGSGNLRVYPKIVSINTNVSFDLDIPASANGTVTLTAQLLEHSRAKLKGWGVLNL